MNDKDSVLILYILFPKILKLRLKKTLATIEMIEHFTGWKTEAEEEKKFTQSLLARSKVTSWVTANKHLVY